MATVSIPEVPAHIEAVARAARGYMPELEGEALYAKAYQALATANGPVLEIGTYCGKSACYLGAAALAQGRRCITIDHHRGSEEMQVGWEHHDASVVDPATQRIESLPEFRRTMERAGLESTVIAIVGDSLAVAELWSTPLAMVFIDGGHSESIALADYDAWAQWIAPGGVLALHDVFEDPADGGQGPFRVWQRAVEDGWVPLSTTGSLRCLTRAN